MAIKSNIIIDQGADYEVTININDANTTPINLTGFVGRAKIRKHYTSLTSYAFQVVVSANTGEVTMSMNSATSSTITPGRYVYDCYLTANNNNSQIESRIIEGLVTITPQVSRR